MISLDTNVVIALMKSDSRFLRLRYREALAAGEVVVASSIVLCELQYGVARSGRVQHNRDFLEKFLAGPVSILAFDAEDAVQAASVRATLAAAGTPIGPYDVLIAGQALRQGATLVTRNVQKFSRVPNLKVEDWAGR